MEHISLDAPVVFRLGSIPVGLEVVTTWAIMAALTLAAWLGTRKRSLQPGSLQAFWEVVVSMLEAQLREVLNRDPRPHMPLIGTLFIFIAACNLSPLIPGVRAPTASLETTAALALIVFFSAHIQGVRALGLRHYLKAYIEPNPLFLPLNVVGEISRTFSLMVRLFGNIMSHELVLGIVISLAALLVPVPFMALGVLVGLIQAYIFSILATVFLGAAIGAIERG